jgi:hypothetical protein
LALVALLDANVLWSAAVRDALLLAAERGLFRPVWSRQILEEMARNLRLDGRISILLESIAQSTSCWRTSLRRSSRTTSS